MWINPKKNKKGMRLDLGSGNPKEGERRPDTYVLNDIEPHEGIDLVCDILDLEKHIKKGWCYKIRISHVLEHFGYKDCGRVLDICYKLLEKGGELEIEVPNFAWFFQLLLDQREEEAVKYCFGGQLDKYDFHKNGFTVNTLPSVIEKHGFKVIELLERQSIYARAIKWTLS